MTAMYVFYNVTDTAPQTVIGWLDNTNGRYRDLPPAAATLPDGYLEVSADIWLQHMGDLTRDHWQVKDGAVVWVGSATMTVQPLAAEMTPMPVYTAPPPVPANAPEASSSASTPADATSTPAASA